MQLQVGVAEIVVPISAPRTWLQLVDATISAAPHNFNLIHVQKPSLRNFLTTKGVRLSWDCLRLPRVLSSR